MDGYEATGEDTSSTIYRKVTGVEKGYPIGRVPRPLYDTGHCRNWQAPVGLIAISRRSLSGISRTSGGFVPETALHAVSRRPDTHPDGVRSARRRAGCYALSLPTID